MTPLTSVSGLASGIDFQALADAIIAAKRAPIRALEKQIAGKEERSQAYVSLDARLKGLQAAARALEKRDGLITKSVSVEMGGGAPASFRATAGPGAALGSYDVSVLQLATSERLGGGVFSDRAAELGIAGSFDVNGAQVTLDPGDSLDDVVARINALEGGEVRASVVRLAEGEAKLVLSSRREGAQGMELADPDGVLVELGLLTAAGERSEVLQAGADARLRVEGVEVTRSSNRMDDVLDGVTFELLQVDSGGGGIMQISRSTEGLRSAIETLVEAYNAVAGFARAQAVPMEGPRPPLAGDPVLRSVARVLQAAMGGMGTEEGEPGPRRLADLGISLQVDGTFSIDRARLDGALASDPDRVARLFAVQGGTSDPGVAFVTAGANTEDGSYSLQVDAMASAARADGASVPGTLSGVGEGDRVRIRSLDGSKTAEVVLQDGMTLEALAGALSSALAEEGLAVEAGVEGGRLFLAHSEMGSRSGFRVDLDGGAAVLTGLPEGEFRGTDVEGTVNGQAARGVGNLLVVEGEGPAQGLSIQIYTLPQGGEAVVSLRRGIGAQVRRLVTRVTGDGSGSLNQARDRLQQAADRMRSRVETIADRLDVQRDELNRRFAAVEEAISRAQSQGTYLAAQLDQIGRFQYGPRRR